MNNSIKINIVSFLLFVSIIFSYIISEDTLGGAKIDFYQYEDIIYLFSEDLFNTLKNYSSFGYTRNSPVFFIILSYLYKLGLELDLIRYLNIVSVFLITYSFYNCLKIKFNKVDVGTLKILSLVLLLSPTVRSLAVWPYPILYAFILFLFSIKYYLLFCRDKKNKLKNALLNVIFIAAASYFTPNFCIFAIFFTYKFLLEFKYTKKLFYILALNFCLALPAFIFYYTSNFYILNISVTANTDTLIKFNIFNKVVVIASIIFFYFIPFLEKNSIAKFTKELKILRHNYLIIFFILICLLFYNFPPGYGGGIFYHISYKLFSNSIILFLVFFVSIYIFRSIKIFNLNNILIFICLILYNLQASIFHKYFDPLILFIFLFLVNFKKGSVNFNMKEITKKYYFLYLFFLAASFYKVSF